ncbi:MAG TPA: ATP-binding protein, partial [Candidatus Sulfotelmatobacter sp.]|nr:ATP-binding protein [Candidatus Sulfotelmatobacter sp.]
MAQIRLLYANANVGVGVTLLAATILAWLQWGTVSSTVVLGWWIYMVLVSVSRYTLVWRYHRVSPESNDIGRWRAAFVAGAAFAGIGWGAAGILLYPPAHLTNQVFLVFVLGGMMLGAATLLYPRPEAFLAFLIPTGLAPSFRLLLQGDETHLAMGLLAAVFTLATLITTGRIYVSVESSLQLQHENRDLVDDLNAAKSETEALNQALELRVEERTAELSRSTEQLREEIAHREQVEEELLRARKLESLGVLAGGIAHDFNNFLTVVQGYIEMAKTHIKAGEPVHEFLAGAASACQRAKFLSSQLLTFAKGGAPVRRLTSVSSLVTDAVHLARAGTPISIELLIAEDLRSAEVDPGQISQVLHNILLNARQAMPHGGGIIEVRAENAIRDNSGNSPWIRISIRDYGGGIPADVLSRIFDPYFTTKPGSSGLGLATSYAIVAKHGGHLSVESRPGHGTTFTIDLPASFETPPPQAAEPAADLHRGAERLLVMDDEEALRTLLHSVLGGLGYEVVTARDGAEAIARYEEAKATAKGYDAVLLDLTVSGGMGGLEAAAQLRELDPSVKLIVSSGYSDSPVLSDFAGY